MKKIKGLFLLALGLPLLAGCQNTNHTAEMEAARDDAIGLVSVAYNKFSSSDGINLAGAKLIEEQVVNNFKFSFEYEVQPYNNTTYDIEYLKVENNLLVVEIPTFAELNSDDSQTITYAAYVLHGTVKYAGYDGEKEVLPKLVNTTVATHDWRVRINAEEVKPVWERIAEARTKATGQTVVTSGYVCAFMNPVDSGEFYQGVWVADGSNGMMLYSGCLDSFFGNIQIGDLILVIGTASPYNGLFEVRPTSISEDASHASVVNEAVFAERTEAELAAFTAVNCSDLVKVPVTINSDLSSTTAAASTAISVSVSVGSTSYTLYLNKHTNTEHRQEFIDKVNANVGKTAYLTTVMGYNSSKLQFTGAVIVNGGSLADMITFVD
ncbi:MAG: hypothetical protein ACI31G_03025 [Bacilli bacterium]